MGFQAEIMAGLRQRLLDAELPTVVIGPIRENLDRAVSLMPFPVDDEATTGVSYLGVKVFIRTPNPDGAKTAYDDQDAVFEAMTSLDYTDVGGHVIACAVRDRSVPLGLDSVNRYLVADTYYLTTNR